MIRRPTQALARSAFTLMEMLVVVAILVVLAGASVPIYLNYLEGARLDRVRIDTKSLETAVDAYYTRHGDYPQSLEELTQVDPDTSKAYLEVESLKDPWGQYYVYNPSDRDARTGRPVIYSTKKGRPAPR
jgi:general secretion pathway protein G